ncbi:porin family protein [Flavobacterium sp.]|uniref:porin family protein n=1 Tax=Flavobacterium sp. TaxID=239 RepID=UPI004033AA6E
MKKILLSAVAVMAFGAAAQAQSEDMKFGVKAGVNLTNFTGDFDGDGATSFYVGGLVDLPVSGNFHVQPEVLYSMEGADKASLSYVRVPIMAKYYVMEGLSLQAGPEVAFKVGAEDDLMDEATKSIDFGIGAGVGYELPMGLFFDARYNLGMSNISESDAVDFKNTGIQIGLGWRF